MTFANTVPNTTMAIIRHDILLKWTL